MGMTMEDYIHPIACMVHFKGYDPAPRGWPKGVPLCPECLREWVVRHSRILERIANPPALGISISEGVGTDDRLR